MPKFNFERESSEEKTQLSEIGSYRKYKKKKEYLKVKDFLPTVKDITILVAKEFIKKIIEIILD